MARQWELILLPLTQMLQWVFGKNAICGATTPILGTLYFFGRYINDILFIWSGGS